jgi:hypothetical protein
MSALLEMAPRELLLWEARTRRRLAAAGLMLAKCRRRSPEAWDFGLYEIVDRAGNFSWTGGFSLNQSEVEDWVADRLTSGGASSDAEPMLAGWPRGVGR